jgi:nitric oxide reductase NorE protein
MTELASRARRIPGEAGLWIFVLGDMTVFALLFGVFLYERHGQAAVFAESREDLGLAFGATNTLVLLTSSVFVALAVQAHRDRRARLASRLVAGAGACALVFVCLKGLEWSSLLADGHDPGSNDFFLYFFALTGLHLVHLLLGAVGLAVLWRTVRKEVRGDRDTLVVEVGASYWHMVDLLWVVIFPLVYLVAT